MKKKLTALLLVVVLAFSLCGTALAADPVADIAVTASDTNEITVNATSSTIPSGDYWGAVWTLNNGAPGELVTLFNAAVPGTATISLGTYVATAQPLRVTLSQQDGSGRYYVDYVDYVITKAATSNGTFTVASNAYPGQTVTITPSASSGYTVDTITVTDANGNNVTVNSDNQFTMPASNVTVSVTFKPGSVSVTGVTLNKSTLSLTVGGSETLTANVQPTNATNKSVTWSTSDPTVATVVNGTVTAVKAGTATITVTTTDGSKTATCTVTVGTSGGSTGGGGGASTPSYGVTVPSAQNGTVTVSPRNATEGATVTITPKPNQGYEVGSVSVTDASGNLVSVTKNSNGAYTFKMPKGKVTVDVDFTEISPVAPVSPFTDVAPGTYFYDAVLWAVDEGVTTGTTATTFSPYADCTRAQIVTFLWRAAGSPEPATTTCPFTDVDMGGYYGKAVLWAVERGITNGTSATTFSPNDICSRAQIVTFLWRYAGSPEPASTTCPFTDVDMDSYYGKAVLWAVENGITNGTSATTFSPNNNCTRGQIVTFLYRYMGE